VVVMQDYFKFRTDLGADFFEDLPEPVFAGAAVAAAPVMVVGGVFNDVLVAGGEEKFARFCVGAELGEDGLAHHVLEKTP
jgi:hypothetical protein